MSHFHFYMKKKGPKKYEQVRFTILPRNVALFGNANSKIGHLGIPPLALLNTGLMGQDNWRSAVKQVALVPR